MACAKVRPYAFQKLVAILQTHARNKTNTDVEELADAMHVDLPALTRADVVELIENTMARINGEIARHRSGRLH